MEEIKFTDRLRMYLYYIIIGIISIISLVFLPMIGTQTGLAWNLPDTAIGWIIWGVLKLVIATINILIFHSFMQQAKINVKDDPKYKEALEILGRIQNKKYIPRSPEKWTKKQYTTKGVSLFISSALTTIAFTQAILTFDWLAMLVYLFTIIMGVIFGIIQMKMAEEYWTDEFWKYAKMVEAEENERQTQKCLELVTKKPTKQGHADIHDNRGTDILESSDSNGNPSDNSESMVVERYDCNYNLLDGTIYTSDTTPDSIDIIIEENIQEEK